AGPLGPRARLSARPPASASGRWPRYSSLLAAPRPGRSGHGLASRLALRAAGAAPCRVPRSLVLVSAGLGAGIAVAFSLPPWGFWPLGIVGFAILAAALADRPAGQRALVATGMGVGMF